MGDGCSLTHTARRFIGAASKECQGLGEEWKPHTPSNLAPPLISACTLESFSPATDILPPGSREAGPLAVPGCHSSKTIPAEKSLLLLASF